MHVPLQDLHALYKHIQATANARLSYGHCTVLLLVAVPDVDALCTARILITLLKSDFIAFKLVPVSQYDDVKQVNSTFLEQNDNICSVILINHGGNIDLSQILNTEKVQVYILDCHRPINLQNVFYSEKIHVVDDGDMAKHWEERLDAYKGYIEESEDEEEHFPDDEEEDEESFMTRAEERDLKRAQQRESRTQRRQRLAAYYKKTWYGSPASLLAFTLAMQLDRVTSDILWCAVIGLTDHYISGHLNEDTFQALSREYRSCLRDLPQHENSALHDSLDRLDISQNELKLNLLNHWNLYESMLYSNPMASRLGTWHERGRLKLEQLLSRMGFPLQECKQEFRLMSASLKAKLVSQWMKCAKEMHITVQDMKSTNGFVRRFGLRGRVTAVDACLALSALMVRGVEKRHWRAMTRHEAASTSNTALPFIDDFMEDSTAISLPSWQRHFYVALEALDSRRFLYLSLGIESAIQLQKAIARVASAMMLQQQMKLIKTYRILVMNASSAATTAAMHWNATSQSNNRNNSNDNGKIGGWTEDEQGALSAVVFSQPFMVFQLGHYLMDVMRATKQHELPFVLAMLNESTQKYIIVGFPAKESKEEDLDETGGMISHPSGPFNHFGLVFKRTAQQIHATLHYQGFSHCVIELDRSELAAFMQSLQAYAA